MSRVVEENLNEEEKFYVVKIGSNYKYHTRKTCRGLTMFPISQKQIDDHQMQLCVRCERAAKPSSSKPKPTFESANPMEYQPNPFFKIFDEMCDLKDEMIALRKQIAKLSSKLDELNEK